MGLFQKIEREEFNKLQKTNWLITHKVLWVALLITSVSILKLAVFVSITPKDLRASDLTLQNILGGINEQRSLRNIPILSTDSRLSFAAQEKSDDMQKRHYFSHKDPEGNYIWDKIVAAGYTPYSALGENLAIEFYSTESLVQAWMNSPTHRENVLNENFKDQGMGLNLGDTSVGQYHSAITNTFGSLLSNKPPSPIATPAAKTNASKTTTQKNPSAPASNLPTPTPTSLPSPSITELTPSMALQPAGSAPSLNIRDNFENLAAQSNIQPLAENNIDPKTNSAETGIIGHSKNFEASNKKLGIGLACLLILLLFADLKLLQKGKFPGVDKKINNLSLLFLAILLTVILYWF